MEGDWFMTLTWNDSTPTVYTEVSGTVTFERPDVDKIYIDWGDGTDNTLENAIYQWSDIDGTLTGSTFTHTYTQTGTFAPILRTVNSKGFLSKYYGSSSTNTSVSPYESVGTQIQPITVADGTPTAINRIENKTVLSGIDNTIFDEGPKEVWVVVPPLAVSSTAVLDKDFQIEVEAIVQDRMTDESGDGGDVSVRTLSVTPNLATQTSKTAGVTSYKLNDANNKIKSILKAKFMYPKVPSFMLDGSGSSGRRNDDTNAWNKMKAFLIASGSDGYFYPITYVSAGDPVKSVDDIKRQVTLDFTQSRAKASNTSIDYYIYDNGKIFFQPMHQWISSGATGLADDTATSGSTLVEGYTYMPRYNGLQSQLNLPNPVGTNTPAVALQPQNVWMHGGPGDEVGQSYYIRDQMPLDNFNRFYNQYHLTRAQINTNSDKFSTMKSFDSIYRITPTLDPGSVQASGNTVIDVGPSTSGSLTALLTSGAYANTQASGTNFENWNRAASGSFVNIDDQVRDASEYLILTSDEKINKIFFNVTPYAMNMEASTSAAGNQLSIAGVYYSKVTYDKIGENFSQNVEWQPVKFDNTTRIEKQYRDGSNKTFKTLKYDLAKSGYVTFDMPNDWGTISISGLAGGVFGQKMNFSDSSTGGDTSYLKTFTANIKATGATAVGGKYYQVTGTGVATALAGYSSNEIGCNNYIVRVSGSTDGPFQFWVGSGSKSGWYPDEDGGTLVFQGGNTIDTENTSSTSFQMRRVNIYNIFDGVTKVTNTYDTIDANTANYPFQYMLSGGAQSTIYNDVKDNLNEKYAIKIVISGASGSFMPPSNQHGGLEVWNILPYNNSYSQVINQVDNSAYDLTMLQLTSNLNVNYAGTYYQAISKNGKVYIVRIGDSIQNLTLNGVGMGDSSYADGNDPFNNNNPSGNTWPTYSILKKIRDAQNNNVRVMWDEKQKDGTWVRFFGFITSVQETNQMGGPRASRTFTSNMIVEEICLMDGSGKLLTDVIPLGGIKDAKSFN
jgi:hypothetical protein